MAVLRRIDPPPPHLVEAIPKKPEAGNSSQATKDHGRPLEAPNSGVLANWGEEFDGHDDGVRRLWVVTARSLVMLDRHSRSHTLRHTASIMMMPNVAKAQAPWPS